jgi:hypothetical protein
MAAPLSPAHAPAVAMGMTYLSMADSMSLAMQNAVTNQQRGQAVTAAAVCQTLALIIKLGGAKK